MSRTAVGQRLVAFGLNRAGDQRQSDLLIARYTAFSTINPSISDNTHLRMPVHSPRLRFPIPFIPLIL